MNKHTKAIRRLLPKNYLSVFDHFVGLALKALTLTFSKIVYYLLKSSRENKCVTISYVYINALKEIPFRVTIKL